MGEKTKKLVIKNGVNKLDTPNINKLDKLIIPGSIKRKYTKKALDSFRFAQNDTYIRTGFVKCHRARP